MSSIDPDHLLKEATQKKNENEYDEAIELLKKAYDEISKHEVIYGINTYLRLPLYLQEANRIEEAWSEFNKLLKEHDNSIMNKSEIYDKMRLLLQRESRFIESIHFGIYSYFSWAIGLYQQRDMRSDDYELWVSEDRIKKEVTKLLKKAKKIDLVDPIVKIITDNVRKIPEINFSEIDNSIDKVLNT